MIVEALFIIAAAGIIIYYFRNRLRKPFSRGEKKYVTIDDQFNADKRARELEIDGLLSKMGKNGLEDLSQKERKRLDELSKK